jgi:hypothetical protein
VAQRRFAKYCYVNYVLSLLWRGAVKRLPPRRYSRDGTSLQNTTTSQACDMPALQLVSGKVFFDKNFQIFLPTTLYCVSWGYPRTGTVGRCSDFPKLNRKRPTREDAPCLCASTGNGTRDFYTFPSPVTISQLHPLILVRLGRQISLFPQTELYSEAATCHHNSFRS